MCWWILKICLFIIPETYNIKKSKKPKMITEIRIYKLKENASAAFFNVFSKESQPLMQRWNVNVVDYGFSLIDKDSFYLIRNYASIMEVTNGSMGLKKPSWIVLTPIIHQSLTVSYW